MYISTIAQQSTKTLQKYSYKEKKNKQNKQSLRKK